MIFIPIVVGKTNPFLITLARTDKPFFIDEFFKVGESICRVTSSECYSAHSLISVEKDVYNDVSNLLEKEQTVYIARAKVENSTNVPVLANIEATLPSFSEMKDILINANKANSFKLGEIIGTARYDIPDDYKGLVLLRNKDKLVKQEGLPVLFAYKNMHENPHIGLFGASGSGKTVCLKVLLEECMHHNIPAIVLDPHLEMNFSAVKSEIPDSHSANFKPNFEIFSIGKNIGIEFDKLDVEELISTLQFSGEMSGAMISTTREIHERGDTFAHFSYKLETLIVLQAANDQGIPDAQKKIDYGDSKFEYWNKLRGKISTSPTLQAISWRINALSSLKVFENGLSLIERSILNKKVSIIRGELKFLNIISAHVISRFYTARKNYVDSFEYNGNTTNFPPFILAMDEAHTFCPKGPISTPMKSILKTIAQEGRKYGVFEIMATQRPSLLDETIVAQMSSKFIFKLGIKEDLLTIEKETDLTKEEIARLPYLKSGNVFISSSLFSRTISAQIRINITESKTKQNPFDELEGNSGPIQSDSQYILKKLPLTTMSIATNIAEYESAFGRSISVSEVISMLEDLVDSGKIKKDSKGFEDVYEVN